MQRYSCIISNGFQQISEWIKFNKISHKTISNSYLHESTLALHFLFASRAIACQRVAIAESKHWTKLICVDDFTSVEALSWIFPVWAVESRVFASPCNRLDYCLLRQWKVIRFEQIREVFSVVRWWGFWCSTTPCPCLRRQTTYLLVGSRKSRVICGSPRFERVSRHLRSHWLQWAVVRNSTGQATWASTECWTRTTWRDVDVRENAGQMGIRTLSVLHHREFHRRQFGQAQSTKDWMVIESRTSSSCIDNIHNTYDNKHKPLTGSEVGKNR